MLTQILTPIIKLRGLINFDLIILAVIFVVLFLYTVYFGKNRIISLILSFYPSVFLFKSFPWVSKLLLLHGDKMLVLNNVGIFLIFFLPLNIIINRYIFSESGHSGMSHVFRIVGFAFSATILVVLFSYSVVNLDIFYNFSPALDALFASPDRVFIWELAPIALLAFLWNLWLISTNFLVE